MMITFDRPLFATGNPIPITVNDTEAGSMKRWFKPREERTSTDPRHEVNISMQDSGKIFGVTQVTTPVGLKQKHRIEAEINEDLSVSVEAVWQRKGKVMMNGDEIGRTETKGFLMNSRYVVEIDEPLPDTLEPALLAGMVYTFWCSF